MKRKNLIVFSGIYVFLAICGACCNLFLDSRNQSWQVYGWFLAFLLFAAAVSAVFCLIFQKGIDKHCNMGTALVSLGLSAAAGCGGYCFLKLLMIVFLLGLKRHPIARVGCSIVLLISMVAFAALMVIYCILRTKNKSGKGVCVDVAYSFLHIPAFFVLSMIASQVFAKIF